MPRFSIKDLLLATLLIAIGIALLLPLFSHAPPPWYVRGIETEAAAMLWFGGCSTIGAGLFVPFQRARTGAILGAVLALIFWVIFLLTIPRIGNTPSRELAKPAARIQSR
jgi:hypothetical protein